MPFMSLHETHSQKSAESEILRQIIITGAQSVTGKAITCPLCHCTKLILRKVQSFFQLGEPKES